jgi:hypothetical protein
MKIIELECEKDRFEDTNFEFKCKLIDLICEKAFLEIDKFMIIGRKPLPKRYIEKYDALYIGTLINSSDFDLLDKIYNFGKDVYFVLKSKSQNEFYNNNAYLMRQISKREYKIYFYNSINIIGLDINKPKFKSDFFEGIQPTPLGLNLAIARAQVLGLKVICQESGIFYSLFNEETNYRSDNILTESVLTKGKYKNNLDGSFSLKHKKYNISDIFFIDCKGNIVQRFDLLLKYISECNNDASVIVITSHKDVEYGIIKYKSPIVKVNPINLSLVTCDFIKFYNCGNKTGYKIFDTICPNVNLSNNLTNRLDSNYQLTDTNNFILGTELFPQKYINFANNEYFSRKDVAKQIIKIQNEHSFKYFEHDLCEEFLGRWYYLCCFLVSSRIVIVVENINEICEFIYNIKNVDNLFTSQKHENKIYKANYKFINNTQKELIDDNTPNTLKITIMNLFQFLNIKQSQLKKFDYKTMLYIINNFEKLNIGSHINFIKDYEVITEHLENMFSLRGFGNTNKNINEEIFLKLSKILFPNSVFPCENKYEFFNNVLEIFYPFYSSKQNIYKEIKTLDHWILYFVYKNSRSKSITINKNTPLPQIKEEKVENIQLSQIKKESKEIVESIIRLQTCYFCSIDVTKNLYDDCFITITDDIKRIVCKKCAKELTKNERIKYTEENWNKSVKKLFKNSINTSKPLIVKSISPIEENVKEKGIEDKINDIVDTATEKIKGEKVKRKERRKLEKEKMLNDLKGKNPSLVEGIESNELKEKIYELQVSLPIEILKRDDDNEENTIEIKSKKKKEKKDKLKDDISSFFEYKFNKE